ncbi:hypothetical protein B0T10DRAFT_486512 [Thelonectria olida]|uniref:Uncharacterized protein n=1 Tax=Thelonectria olida TaxID=1576542 RepID=A0A9P8W6P8_9HYPO|nr:hypothetical protein B0T10DRAFT_486512 [Thelonectria olida]
MHYKNLMLAFAAVVSGANTQPQAAAPAARGGVLTAILNSPFLGTIGGVALGTVIARQANQAWANRKCGISNSKENDEMRDAIAAVIAAHPDVSSHTFTLDRPDGEYTITVSFEGR